MTLATRGQTFDSTELDSAIAAFARKNKNLDMKVYAENFITRIDDMFESSGIEGTEGRWDPLTEDTMQRWPRRNRNRPLLKTPLLATFGVKYQTAKKSTASFQIKSVAQYAGFHVTGTENMVRRDFFALNFMKAFDEMADSIMMEYQRA